MPNVIDANGVQVDSLTEIVDGLTADLQTIYGADAVLTSDTPDGQWINNIAQVASDNNELILQVNAQFSPTQAVGVILDERVAINGIQRQAGTATVQAITIITSSSCTLVGLDTATDSNPPYTIADSTGYQYFLKVTENIAGAGTTVSNFEASTTGPNTSAVNTITVPVTIVLGVTSVNNPSTYTTLGTSAESDASLRLRQQQSTAISGRGWYASLFAALSNTVGVTSVEIIENDTNATDGDGVPSHSIWVIVQGTYSNDDVARVIFQKRNAGCGMFGSISVVLDQITGDPYTGASGQQPFVVRFDTVSSENLFIKFTATSLDGINPPNVSLIRSDLPNILIPGVNQQVNINDLATLVQEIDNNTLVTNAGFSYTHLGSYTPTLSPSAKTKFFAVTSPDIIILPMQSSPSSATVVISGTQAFQGVGGFGAYVYTVTTNNSGSPGFTGNVYTAGATPNVTDVITITDADSNTITANVQVIP